MPASSPAADASAGPAGPGGHEQGPIWRTLLARARQRLGSESEARRIVEQASGFEGAEFVLGLDSPVSTRAEPYFEQLLERRAAGEPLQYVLGRWGFRRLDLFVDRRVLIPRPETEVVVDVAISELRRLGVDAPTVVDLGTGSGAIGLAMAVEVPAASIWATDASPDALAVARANLAGLGSAGARVRLVEGIWFDALPDELRGHIDLVVSNPPYIADDEPLPAEVADWEPVAALRSGPTGLEAIEAVVSGAREWLRERGVVVVEIAPHQRDDGLEIALSAGFTGARVEPDLTGRARVLVASVG